MEPLNIWIVCDDHSYEKKHILQLISRGHELSSKINAVLSVIYIGNKTIQDAKILSGYGVDQIIYADCNSNDVRVRTDIIIQMVHTYRPNVILVPATKDGKYIAATISIEFESGLTAECIDITIEDNNEFIFSRAALSSSVIAAIKCINSKLHLCTVKDNVFEIKKSQNQKSLLLEQFTYQENNTLVSEQLVLLQRKLIEARDDNEWQYAKTVFAVGRGVSDQEDLERIHKLAKKFDAEVVGTRAAVEEGLIEKQRQVGQSGVSVCPNVYVGFGVSGASQHIVGMKNSKLIIAINKDKDAPIFDYADYAIVEDVKSIINGLEELDS